MSEETIAPSLRVWEANGKRWSWDGKAIRNLDTGEVALAASEPKSALDKFAGRGTRWLAERLGVSRQRASALLNSGRVVGASWNPLTGAWDCSRCLFSQVRPGTRGPRLGAKLTKKRQVALHTVK